MYSHCLVPFIQGCRLEFDLISFWKLKIFLTFNEVKIAIEIFHLLVSETIFFFTIDSRGQRFVKTTNITIECYWGTGALYGISITHSTVDSLKESWILLNQNWYRVHHDIFLQMKRCLFMGININMTNEILKVHCNKL